MKSRNIGLGIFILSIGVLWLLMSFGVIDWSIFDSIFTLWPLVFVVIGLSILFRNNSIVRAVLWVLFLAVLIIYGSVADYNYHGSNKTVSVTMQKLTETKYGELQLSLGGADISVDSGANQTDLVDATVSERDIRHSINYSNGRENATVKFSRHSYSIFGGHARNDCNVHLNSDILWDLNVDTGAVSGNLDLSALEVKNVDMDIGAAKMSMILGNKYNNTNVDIDAGASSINVTVPSDSGVRVNMDGALNSTNLKNLGWSRNGKYYTSPNYDSAANKINIEVDMGVGSFNINVAASNPS
ncbi:MAG: DUF5668 domain-containing protein [Bacillota bacterium]|nr:DUF5668 domain-containing protein [Bacillota bacterium]